MADSNKRPTEESKKFLNRPGLEHFIVEISKRVASKILYSTQSDWEETNPESPSYIKNKPVIEHDEETFVFKNDLTTTTDVGKYHPSPAEPIMTIEAKDKTFKEVWNDIFNEEKLPETTEPSMSLSVSGNVEKEIGTQLTISVSQTLNPGSYTYDESTGVEISNCFISIAGEEVSTSTSYTGTVISKPESQTIKGSIDYTDGIVPKTNLGNPCPEKQIKSGRLSKTATIPAGFRCMYYGFMNAADKDSFTIEEIKSLNKIKFTTKEYDTFKVTPDLPDSMIVAIPASGKKITVIQPSSLNSPVYWSKELKGALKIGGIDNYEPVDYDIYVFTPDEMKDTNDFKITIE